MEPSLITSDSDHASSSGIFFAASSSPYLPSPSPAGPDHADVEALKRLSDNLHSIFRSPDFAFFSDATVLCSGGIHLPLHRCVLSARSPFFRDFFKTRCNNGNAAGTDPIETSELLGDFAIGYEALALVMEYIYSGRVGQLPRQVCICVDDACPHTGCRPAVEFMVEVLYASFKFHITELVSLFQRRLIDVLKDVAIDDVPMILSVSSMCDRSCEKLLERCIDIVAHSDLDMVSLEKKVSPNIVKQIMEYRVNLGHPHANSATNIHARRIHRALDSDDIELVRMLLKEGHTTLDDAYALHYAVEHCDSKITIELLDLELADVNHRNLRDYTVLHVAAMRKEPKIIISLLTKGARPSELTPDGRKAVDIAKRMTKFDNYRATEEGKATPKDMLCIDILEQAERRDPLIGEASVSLAMAGDDMRGKLLYLENRVALARIMFPMEAQVAMDIAHVDGTLEFTLGSSSNLTNGNNRSAPMDLNETPFQMKEEYRARMKALARTVELGKKFFPRCSDVLNKIMDDDLPDLAAPNRDTSEEKRRRFNDLQDVLQKAFCEDRQEWDRSTQSSSSSTSIHRARR